MHRTLFRLAGWWLLTLAGPGLAQDIRIEDPGGGGTGASPEAAEAAGAAATSPTLQEALRLVLLWLQSYWVHLALSVLGLWLLSVIMTRFWGAVIRVRPLEAPSLGVLSGLVLWAGLVVYFFIFRSTVMNASSLPWTFWAVLGTLGGILLAFPLVSFFKRRAL